MKIFGTEDKDETVDGVEVRDPAAYPVSPRRDARAVKKRYILETEAEAAPVVPSVARPAGPSLRKPEGEAVAAAQPVIEPAEPEPEWKRLRRATQARKLLSPAQRKATRKSPGQKVDGD